MVVIVMKKGLKIVIIIVMAVILAIDFIGLWKYKLNGKKYELQTASDDVAAEEHDIGNGTEESIEYEDLTSTTLTSLDKLFIKNIEKNEDGTYAIKGLVVRLVEISNDSYTSLKSGKEVEILGATYTKKQIKSNNLILKSEDENAKDYYIKYDTISKKYVLKDATNDASVYEKTDKYVSINVDADFSFITDKNGKTTKSTIEKVVESHKDVAEPEEATSKINVCVLTFDKSGKCTKLTEYCM